jgi:putative membrane protein
MPGAEGFLGPNFRIKLLLDKEKDVRLNRTLAGLSLAATVAIAAVPAAATLPTPPQAAATRQAQAYLFHAGAGDVFEITSSMILLNKSSNPQVRNYASTLIDHHTRTTNLAIANAKAAGVMPPPPEMTPMQKTMIGRLHAATPATINQLYLQQQVPAHQQALALQSGYARGGDTPALRQTAQAAVPIIQAHLDQARQLLRSVR